MKNSPEENKYSQGEMAELEKGRTISDAELLEEGAEYKINEKGQKNIELTEKQIKAISFTENKHIFEIVPDEEIISAHTAKLKIEAKCKVSSGFVYEMLKDINWEEKLKNSYKIVSISVKDLLGDNKEYYYEDIVNKAKEKGFDLIPARLAPTIYLKLGDNNTGIIATNRLLARKTEIGGHGGNLFRIISRYGGFHQFDYTYEGENPYEKHRGDTSFFFVSKY